MEGLPCARHRKCMASIEPRASPSGLTWHARATSSDRSIAAAAWSSASISVSIFLQPTQDVFHPLGGLDGGVGAEAQLGRALQAHLTGYGPLQAHPISRQHLLPGRGE